jgi:hypothetical protein
MYSMAPVLMIHPSFPSRNGPGQAYWRLQRRSDTRGMPVGRDGEPSFIKLNERQTYSSRSS